MFEPRPALLELSETEAPFEADTAKNTGLSFPQLPVRGPSSQEGQDASCFYPASYYMLLGLSFGQV